MKFPDAAFVELRVFLPLLNKSATIRRKVSSPAKPSIVPDDADIKAALAEIADHPEITLSRREVLRFILVEPTKRSEEIQTILKLEEIGQTRSALNTAQNKLQAQQRTTAVQVETSQRALSLHLKIAKLSPEELLKAVNRTGIGPEGLGGKVTAMAVHVETHPCHIASLPVAVNINCHAARHKTIIL
jgi:hypothetical protein